ncbi:MAG: hypothetical protein K2L86_02765 [Lachnospiraceae bacterium]|nr:hypothetical protein [Lachnospiraceae bacterium]
MRRVKFQNLMYFILLYIFSGIVVLHVDAAELELEPATSNVSNPYKFKISYTWISEGETIESFDVSESGQIAIAFTNKTIGVFDHDMNFLYQISFEATGASGVLWLDDNLLFIDLRSNTGIACNQNGCPENYYEITGPRNYFYKIVQNPTRNQGNDQYYCTNGSNGNDSIERYSYYTILKRVSEKGEEEILYEVDTLFDGVFAANLFKFAYVGFNFIVPSLIVFFIYRNRARRNS